jgi:hypothetical protein
MLSLIAPVRPTLQSSYPLTPCERYVEWKRDDDSPFDPWLRVHRRLSAESLTIMPDSLAMTGTVAEWEEWAGMISPGVGEYVGPGALQSIAIDREQDLGRCVDPNVWMRHRLPREETVR